MSEFITIDGNEAAARVAYAVNEVIAIYPITPASPMGELSDAWSASGRRTVWGGVPQVIEMQSEGGAAGAMHGGLQGGALTTTFTASQGLLLMIPNMFKIAGELSPAVIHVAARSVATHALSIFGDHSDVMATRSTGFAMLCSASVQEAHDFALIAQASTLKSRVPFLHFFDGFRTSHEVNKIAPLAEEQICALIVPGLIREHRKRALDPDRPVLRGTAQNPDVFFQAREAANPFYDRLPEVVQSTMDRFAKITGRRYQAFEYVGSATAERVIVMMGSGIGAAEEAVEAASNDENIGLLKVRLYRPFDSESFVRALPVTVRSIAVLDRTKEPGAVGEPLYQDVLAALMECWRNAHGESSELPRVIGGRYGLSSKEFTPAMVIRIFGELSADEPKRHFTIGIHDDVTLTSLKWDAEACPEAEDVQRAVFYGLGSDGTVGANKNSVKIVGENTSLHAQGYFVYDSKKAGSVTTSHLRFSPRPIKATYLIRKANFVACHQFEFLRRMDVLDVADHGATFLLNSPYGPEDTWKALPVETQQQIIDKQLSVYVVDAYRIAADAGLGGRMNTVMQTCFFALAGVLPMDEAIGQIKKAIEKTYLKRGRTIVERNCAAVDAAASALQPMHVPPQATSTVHRVPPVSVDAPDFVQRVTGMIIAGRGDLLPVSAMPIDGTFPTGTARYEKRNIAQELPIWDADICIECGLCALVCPHAAIRSKQFDASHLSQAPAEFLARQARDNGHALTIQVAPEDCTGCGVCVDVCPAKSKESVRHKAITMQPKADHLSRERERYDFFLELPEIDRTSIKTDTVKGSQLLQPLFEYSGACAGCGETPYLKLLTQLFGDRTVVANATGCSSIFGGNLPTTPWSTNAAGRGPAWSNSLFEDNAEFGLGIRLAIDGKRELAERLLRSLAGPLGEEFVTELVESAQLNENDIADQRRRVDMLRHRLAALDTAEARELECVLEVLVRRSMWIVGGDGWAYDIGYGGLDHVLASGRDVNVLVLDTGVYSNTGGQASKATPRAASAKFASNGRNVRRKDLGMMAVTYGNVYVAQIAVGANPAQTVRALNEAESYPGPSLILAYSNCIAHGIDMRTSMTHQKDLVKSAFWPLFRYDPRHAQSGQHPFHLDSRKPTVTFKQVAMKEARFAMLARSNPTHAKHLMDLAQKDIDDTWHYYEQMAVVDRELAEKV